MFKNYLRTAVRNLARKKGYSFINIAGLTIGLASCLIIFQFVVFEYSFDGFHEHEDDIYRVLQAIPLQAEPFEAGGAYTPYGLGPALEEDVPEVRHVTRVHPDGAAIVSNPARAEMVFEEGQTYYVDRAFLQMFTFPLTAGSIETALQPGTILLSESTAEKYFPSSNPIGQPLRVTGQVEGEYRVAGIFEDVPTNSHLAFDLLLPMEDLIRESYDDEPEGGWSWNNFSTYVQLRSDANVPAVEQKMTDAYEARRGEELRQQGRKVRLWAQPLEDIHLNAEIVGPANEVMGSYRTVYFFTVIGLVTLLIALVNYVNLATARALDRAREVGVRKAIGAQRRQLLTQFLSESAFTNLIAAVFAVVFAVVFTPVVNNLADTELTGALWTNAWFWVAFIVTFSVATLLAGLYPAFVLSSFKPVSVLKARTRSVGGQLWLRRGLVVLQFAASVVLIGGTAVVYDQLTYMRRMDLGLDLDQVLTVTGPSVLPEGTDQATAMSTFVERLRSLPDVRQVATSTSLPGQGFNWNGASVRRAEDPPASVIRGVATYVDTSFAALYGLELVAGRGFEDITAPPSDSSDAPWSVIANETAVRTLGFKSPSEAVGHALDIGGNDAVIAGVYKDFKWTSAHQPQQNIFFGRFDAGRRVSLRIAAADISSTISTIENVFESQFPGNVFQYEFLDEAFDQQYQNDERFATLFTLFAGLAIAIACLGLFGLASFTTQQRTKEIGVRKVLGATPSGLVGMLAKDFLKLVVVAVVIALPLAYLLMQRWLEQFAYRIDVEPGLFAVVGAATMLLALLTVAYQSIRAAMTDPAQSLRME